MVVGVIVAGIIGGQSLIRTAKLRSVINDVSSYKAAVQQFEDYYDALPGDMINASSYWPSCHTTPSHCNGNGDSEIDYEWPTDTSTEFLRAWQQLADAKMISGQYSGKDESTPVIGKNQPKSKIKNAGFMLYYAGDLTASSSPVYGKTGHVIRLGADDSSTSNDPDNIWNSAISPPDAHSIDNKIDDGLADSGNIMTRKGKGLADNTCVTGAYNNKPANYRLDNTDILCHVNFFID